MFVRAEGAKGIGAVETASQVTQKSFTAAHYRLSTLAGANIVFRFSHVPEDVCIRIAAIVQRPISMERKRELSRIAHTLHDQFAPILDGAASKEDCVGLFHQALSALGYSDSLLLQRKADWEPNLKPRKRLPEIDLGFLISPQNEAEDSPDRPDKRQQHGNGTYTPLDTSRAAATGDITLRDKDRGSGRMGPPPIPQSDVKTPRPDIPIGLSNDAVVNALKSPDLTEETATDLLIMLAEPYAQNGGRPLLCLGPSQHNLFPFMLVEGKSYATGNTIYEAQNQAVVSGACALEILHRLDDLVQMVKPSSHSKAQHIVFSVCTLGPIHELWVHYTTEKNGKRKYNNKIWKSCNMAVEYEVPGFLEAVDNVMGWGPGEHLQSIANQLRILWAASRPSR
ncbi:MAG: hypothetical protein Q9190_000113 [Brigantiaea leucoxantha]